MKSASRTTATALVLATAGTLFTATASPASAATACTSPVFQRQFYANTSFSGTPRKTDCDDAIDQSWSGAPVSGLPKDNFGVRWTLTRDFGSGGPFALNATGLDGMRVYLDGVRKIDLWKNVSTTVKKTANVTIPSGRHTLRVDYANWTGAAKVKVTYTPRTTATVDKVKPLVPTGTSVTYDKATRKTKVTWAKNKEMDLAEYRVYRRLKGSGTWQKVSTTTSTSATDTPPATGETYYYEVRARDRAGNESTGTADQPVTPPDGTAPAAPSGVTTADGQAGVTVSWSTTAGATEYLVHRRWEDDGQDNPVTQVARVTGTSWLDGKVEDRLTYTYWVTALDAAGNRSAKSVPATEERGDWAPSAPTAVTATTMADGVTLTWQAPTSPVAQDLGRYRIYRDGRRVGEVSASHVSYTDTRVVQGTSYAYTVTALDTQNQESVPSAPVTGTAPATGLAPAAVTGLRGWLDEDGDMFLSWQRSPEEDVGRYDIYYGTLVDGVWRYDLVGDFLQDWADEPNITHNLVGYTPQGETVRWAVVAVDKAGNSLPLTGDDFSYVTVVEPPVTPENLA
ncbi:PA14 domain-containing protein [Streptomyces sp. 351MFTsu5.1]|uniref:PA14 domain-containing protein n=1 Tax=Streptomyces sp. 351MFTsu5.1 TaxID=1172180 RepID=UPI00036B4108|nr:PA14 domain-containing protein [Streptomyces sp. 351MFTsu5.1]